MMAEAEDDGGLQDGECVTVTFAEEGGLGLNFVPALWPAIESIDPDSMASRAEGGALRAGMILVDVQGEDMNGKSLAEAGAAFQKAGRPLRLTFQAPVPSRTEQLSRKADEVKEQASPVASAAVSGASSWMNRMAASAAAAYDAAADEASKIAEQAKVAAEEKMEEMRLERERKAEQAKLEAEAEAAAQDGATTIQTSGGAVLVDSPQKGGAEGGSPGGSQDDPSAPAEGEPPAAATEGRGQPSEPEPETESETVSEPEIWAYYNSAPVDASAALAAELRLQLEERQAELTGKQAEIEALQATAKKAAEDEQAEKKAMEDAWEEERKLKESNDQLEQKVAEVEGQLQQKGEEADALSTELDTVRQSLADRTQELADSKAEVKKRTKMMVKQQKQYDEMEAGLTRASQERGAKSEEADELSRSLEETRKAREGVEEELAGMRERNAALQSTVEQLESERGALRQDVSQAADAKQSVHDDIRGLLAKVQADNDKLEEHCTHVEELRIQLNEAKMSTLLRADRRLDPADLYEKSSAMLTGLRGEIRRQRKKLDESGDETVASVALGLTPKLLLDLVDDVVDARQKLNQYEWDKMQDAYKREEQQRAQVEASKSKFLSSSAASQLRLQNYQNYLYKRGEHNTQYKKRWFDLKNAKLTYYASPGDSSVRAPPSLSPTCPNPLCAAGSRKARSS